MRGGDGRPTVGWITSDKIKLYFAGKNVKDASIWIRQEKDKDLNDEINRLKHMLTILEDRHDIDMSQSYVRANDEINRLRDILSILEDRHDIDMSQFDEEE